METETRILKSNSSNCYCYHELGENASPRPSIGKDRDIDLLRVLGAVLI